MKPAKTLRFMKALACADAQGARTYFEDPHFDPVAFGRLLFENELHCPVYSLGEHVGLSRYLPPEMHNQLRAAHVRQLVRDEAITAELLHLQALFSRNNKEVIFLKGGFLTGRFYPAGARRVVNDVDVLIRSEDVTAVDGFLTGSGYCRQTSLRPAGRLARFASHHCVYLRSGMPVEVHWCLDNHFSFRIDDGALWRTRSVFSFRGKEYAVLSGEYALVVQILSVFNDAQRGYLKLKSLLDMLMILKAMPPETDWKGFFDRRTKEQLHLISCAVLDLALSGFENRIDFPLLAACLDGSGVTDRHRGPEINRLMTTHSYFGLENKRWAFGLYTCGAFAAFCWWVATLIPRLWVHRKDFGCRLKMFFGRFITARSTSGRTAGF